MQFNKSAIKATLICLMTTAATASFADKHMPGCDPTPTPTPWHNFHDPSAVPEPSAWITFAIGIGLIAILTSWSKFKANRPS